MLARFSSPENLVGCPYGGFTGGTRKYPYPFTAPIVSPDMK